MSFFKKKISKYVSGSRRGETAHASLPVLNIFEMRVSLFCLHVRIEWLEVYRLESTFSGCSLFGERVTVAAFDGHVMRHQWQKAGGAGRGRRH